MLYDLAYIMMINHMYRKVVIVVIISKSIETKCGQPKLKWIIQVLMKVSCLPKVFHFTQ